MLIVFSVRWVLICVLSDESEAAAGAQRSAVIGAETCNISRMGGGLWAAFRSGLLASRA